MTWDQVLIVLCGVTAIALSQDPAEARRRWAPIFGLAGQPGWFWAAYSAEQWGILLVSFLYTLAWLRGIRTYWWRPRSRR